MKNITMKKLGTKILAITSLSLALAITLAIPAVASADALYRQLQTGMRGDDVSSLQSFLAKDATLYPQGLVTGYFGYLTKSAVSNFQTRNGIASVGRVGPATLPIINAQLANGTGVVTGGRSASIVNVNIYTSRNSAQVNWNTDELAKGVVYYSTTPLDTYERTNSVDVSGMSAMLDTNLRSVQTVALPNLQANTTYYYLIYTTDQDGNVSVTWPSSFQTTN